MVRAVRQRKANATYESLPSNVLEVMPSRIHYPRAEKAACRQRHQPRHTRMNQSVNPQEFFSETMLTLKSSSRSSSLVMRCDSVRLRSPSSASHVSLTFVCCSASVCD